MKEKRKRRIKENLIGYSFIFPAIVGFFLFMAFPLFYSLYISLMDWNMFKGAAGSIFCGLKNYSDVFKNEYFQTGILNNFKLLIFAVPLLIILSLIIASLLNVKIFGRGLLRAAYFVPYITTITASALVFSALFHPEYGPINNLLRSIGVKDVPGWATSVKWALPTIGLFWIWKNIGYCIVIYLAGLQGISPSYYEAASIDGANKFQRFMKITVPLVSPTTFFLVVTSAINSFQIFAEVNVLTQGGPGTTTTTLVYHIYYMAFKQYKMGYASAVAWVFFLIVVVITAVQWIVQKKWVKYV